MIYRPFHREDHFGKSWDEIWFQGVCHKGFITGVLPLGLDRTVSAYHHEPAAHDKFIPMADPKTD